MLSGTIGKRLRIEHYLKTEELEQIAEYRRNVKRLYLAVREEQAKLRRVNQLGYSRRRVAEEKAANEQS